MLIDYHLHSDYSADSDSLMSDQINRAIELSISELCFTEHLEYDFHLGDWHTDLSALKKAIEDHQNPHIVIKRGVEVGVSCSDESLKKIEQELTDYEPDFVLASLHSYENTDPIHFDMFAGKNLNQLCQNYLETLYTQIQRIDEKWISAIAHPDFLVKGYGLQYFPDKKMLYSYAPDQFDEIFKWVINHGKCIEINTSTARHLNGTIPGKDWLKRYAELGGTYVTIGDDAHKPEQVGFMLREAQQLAMSCGIKYIATFSNMQPTLIKI